MSDYFSLCPVHGQSRDGRQGVVGKRYQQHQRVLIKNRLSALIP